MVGFDELLKGLHSSVQDTPTTQSNIITIDNKRQFTPVDFNTVIAYEGDINSQIITFQLPKKHEGHELSGCTDKILKWKNLASGVEGTFKLKPTTVDRDNEHLYLQWEIAAEAFSEAGNIEISISFYDYADDEHTRLAFSWNTPPYSGLSVGKSNANVGYHFPAKNEILVIDKETKQIVAPAGYNNIICNYGDIGAEIYFLVDRHLGKRNVIDVNSDSTKIAIYVVMNGYRSIDNSSDRIEKQLYTEQIGEDTNGLVLLTWKVPPDITSGIGGANPLQIMLQFENDEQRWNTNTYSNLKVGESLFSMGELSEGDLLLTEDLIEQIVQNYLNSGNFVEDYFNHTNIIIDANIE